MAIALLDSLTETDKKLIEAALRLGDWIAAQPEATQQDRDQIKTVQASLRKLPEIAVGTLSYYSVLLDFGQMDGYPDIPIRFQSYQVDIGAMSDDMPSVEMFSKFRFYPRPGMDKDTAPTLQEMEKGHEIEITDLGLEVIEGSAEGWINEIDRLNELRREARALQITADVTKQG